MITGRGHGATLTWTALHWTRGEREKCVQSDDMQRNYTLYSGLFHATEVVAGSTRHRRTDSLDRWDTVSSQFETFLLLRSCPASAALAAVPSQPALWQGGGGRRRRLLE